MKFRWHKKYLYWGTTAFLVVCASMLFYFGLFHMEALTTKIQMFCGIMMPVIYGAIIAYLLTPIVNFQENVLIYPFLSSREITVGRKGRTVIRYIGIFIALFLAILVIYSLLAMIIPAIIDSIINIVNDSPRYIRNLEHWMNTLANDNKQWMNTAIDLINNYSEKLEAWMNTQLLPQLKGIVQHLTNGVFGALIFLKNILIGMIISIYLMADKEKFIGQSKMYIYSLFDTPRANDIINSARFVDKTFGGFISGKILDSAIIGVLCYIGTSIIGTPYAILVSVIVGCTNVIPFFGPYMGAIPCAILILFVNPTQCLYFLIFILCLQQFDGNILGPKILGESTGLSSFMVIFAILLFGGVFGVSGMIIGVPVCAVICAGLKVTRDRFLDAKKLPLSEETYSKLDYINEENLQPVFFKDIKEVKKDKTEEKTEE